MLCKTRIVFSDEYSVTGIPNRAMADETRSPNYNGTPFSLGISLHHPKALIHIWLAWQKTPAMPMGQAITAQVLSCDCPIALIFIEWLKHLFEPTARSDRKSV